MKPVESSVHNLIRTTVMNKTGSYCQLMIKTRFDKTNDIYRQVLNKNNKEFTVFCIMNQNND